MDAVWQPVFGSLRAKLSTAAGVVSYIPEFTATSAACCLPRCSYLYSTTIAIVTRSELCFTCCAHFMGYFSYVQAKIVKL